jgi:hypothetical protein
LATTKVIVLITYISFTMFLWFPVLDLARAPRRTARKKGSGYENDPVHLLKMTSRQFHRWKLVLTLSFLSRQKITLLENRASMIQSAFADYIFASLRKQTVSRPPQAR